MAAAAITLTDIPAQIECDATGAVITLSTNMPGLHGVLENVGSKAVFVKIKDTAANVPVTGAQSADGVAQIRATGGMFQVNHHYSTIGHKCAGSDSTVLVWHPYATL